MATKEQQLPHVLASSKRQIAPTPESRMVSGGTHSPNCMIQQMQDTPIAVARIFAAAIAGACCGDLE